MVDEEEKEEEKETITVDCGYAFKQAIENLHKASEMAEIQSDPATMVTVAQVWVELGSHLAEADGIVPTEELKKPVKDKVIGFTGGDEDGTSEDQG